MDKKNCSSSSTTDSPAVSGGGDAAVGRGVAAPCSGTTEGWGGGGGGEVQGTKLKRIVFSEHCMDITPLRGKAKRDQRLSLNSGPTL